MINSFSSAVAGQVVEGVIKCVVVRHTGQVRSACSGVGGGGGDGVCKGADGWVGMWVGGGVGRAIKGR